MKTASSHQMFLPQSEWSFEFPTQLQPMSFYCEFCSCWISLFISKWCGHRLSRSRASSYGEKTDISEHYSGNNKKWERRTLLEFYWFLVWVLFILVITFVGKARWLLCDVCVCVTKVWMWSLVYAMSNSINSWEDTNLRHSNPSLYPSEYI